MRARGLTLFFVCLLLGVAVLWFWGTNNRPVVVPNAAPTATASSAATSVVRASVVATTNESVVAESTGPTFLTAAKTNVVTAPKTNFLAYRLANTTKKVGQLLRDDGAILLENALIDTGKPLGFAIPESLRLVGDPGSYIVQSRGPVDEAFRAALAAAGAEIVSYIPNNAYLVRAAADVANRLGADPETQSVLPWEPVYKLKEELLALAMRGEPLPPDTKLNLLVFAGERANVIGQLQKLGAITVNQQSSPLGDIITVQPGANWTALAQLSGVQLLEQAYLRANANDLSRARLGVATDSVTETNYLGLTGTNVLVNLNDSSVDATHPDLVGRVFPINLTDPNGHGTHVAGIIAGNGLVSSNVVNARGSSNPGTNGQYRGIAPGARLFVQRLGTGLGTIPDATLQENAARTNALISNNSWSYVGNSSYSLAAASYDAAVRDSLPGVPGSQPVLYVFSAGNSGGGGDAGLSGNPGSVLSPGTGKNVLTVGAIELARDITNIVTKITGTVTNTGTPWKGMTSSGNQVAAFSSRGNVGIGVEGEFGRFKPDLVAPGTFVVSTRSQSPWDEIAYYNPTNHHYTTLRNQVVSTNTLQDYSIFLPENTVGFTITLFANEESPVPFPDLPIYVKRDGTPTTQTFDLRRTNFVAVPPDLGGVGAAVGQNWFYSIGNRTREEVSFNIITDVITTNDLGDYYTVLSNLNNSISGTNLAAGAQTNFYRYESGTSMAAGKVSGTLALMQEFFEQGLKVTNSPALMKALLINGARSVGNLYDFQVQSSINYQGWGLVKLNNTLPPDITNAFKFGPQDTGSIKVLDQSPTNALATGQSKTWLFSVDEAGQTLPLRVTLAWTDPAGNPAAGVKLVNDLDLIVTNLDTGDVYLGNDIPGSTTFSFPWDTNGPPNLDSVNNIENIFIDSPLGASNSITVLARRVNVNAVTAHTNDVVQDFVLVISSGNGEATNSLKLVSQTAILTNDPPQTVVYVTNSLNTPTFSSATLGNQRVGANTPLLGTTNGIINQWKFYVLTNSTDFTNASFLVSQQTDLATPRMGVFASPTTESTRRYADIDMYVSQDAGLTNLVPAVVAASFKSLSRNDLSGDEFVTFDNSSAGQVYYVGIKSEDQQAAQYEFWGIFSLLPLGAEDANGFVQAYPMLGYDIPDGSPSRPGGTRFVAITRPSLSGVSESVRRVIVTNNVSHENYGDVISSLDHNSRVVVLDNHRGLDTPPYLPPPGPYPFLYDDSGEGDFLNAIPPDGPGTFETYIGEVPGGQWYFTYSDDALSQTGRVNDVRLQVQRQPEDDRSSTNTVFPNSWRYFSRNVPVEATNLTICISNITASATPGPLRLYIRKGRRPTATAYDYSTTILPPGDCFSVNKFSLPPLTAGRYFIGVFNPNASSQTFIYSARVDLGLPPAPTLFNSSGNQPLLDDAVNKFSQTLTNDALIAQVDVGLRIDHPRVSDLAVTLISPRGTRVLLVENRGGTDPNGFGSSLVVSNFVPVSAGGGQAATNIFIDTGATVGTITIDYNFITVPDQMTVYYEGNLLADTTMTNGTGRLTLPYGPGSSTIVEVRMNEFTNTNAGTAWSFTASSISSVHSYLTFTDNTNKTTTPIKFATPPFTPLPAGPPVTISDFEAPTTNGNYFGPSIGVPDGWNVLTTDPVTVVTNPAAYSNAQSLVLCSGQILRTVPTTSGRNYRLNFAYRKVPNLDGIVGWWPGQLTGEDIVGGNTGIVTNGVTYVAGQVGQAFRFNGGNSHVFVPASSNLNVGLGVGFTLEAWINSDNISGARPIFEWSTNTWVAPYGVHFWLAHPTLGPGSIFANIVDTAGAWHVIQAPPGTIIAGSFQHVALTYNKTSGQAAIYVDGVAVVNQNLGIFTPFTSRDLYIGRRPPGDINSSTFSGIIDEPTVYRRALLASEIQTIYAAGASGKFGMMFPPDEKLVSTNYPYRRSPVGAQISAQGRANSFLGTTNWQTSGLVFTATTNSTTVSLAPVTIGGHFYQFFRTNITWHDARATASTQTLFGLSGHLATITSAAENEFIRTNFGTNLVTEFAWIGGRESSTTNRWQWDVGPEANLPFSTNNIPLPPFNYANWGNIEPNNAAPNEDYAMYNIGPTFNGITSGQWADSPPTPGGGNPVVGYIVEYEPIPPIQSGVIVDAITLTEAAGPRYVLPEESLKALEGENAFGVWQLEILDTRTGATNQVAFLDWQLQFIFQTTTALPFRLISGVPNSRTVQPGQTIYYIVDVPPWARFATNSLLFADGPLNIYFNQSITPTGTNTVPPDYTLFSGAVVTPSSVTLTTNLPALPPPAGPPLLLPGQRYYLAIENPSGVTPVNFTFQVDFDLAVFPTVITLTNGIPYCAVNPGPNISLDYYRYTVSSNAVRAQFEIDDPTGDMTLLLQKDLPPTFGVFDYFSANVFTNDEVITVFDFSQPVALSPGDWYLAAANISGGPVSYCVKAIEWPVYGTNIIITNVFLGTNSFCLTWTSLPGVRYYVEGLTSLTSTNWVTASPTVTATGPLTTYCVPLPSPLQFFRVREGIALNVYFPPPVISNIRRIFLGILIEWGGPTNAQYQVQWTPSLAPTNWTAFTNPPAVTSPIGVFNFLDNGSETGGFGPTRFYRLLLLP